MARALSDVAVEAITKDMAGEGCTAVDSLDSLI